MADAGELSVKTNTQESKCQLNVTCKCEKRATTIHISSNQLKLGENEILVGLPTRHEVTERENMRFEIVLRDPNAPLTLYSNEQTMRDDRFEMTTVDPGCFVIDVFDVVMTDQGSMEVRTPSHVVGQQLFSKCHLTVIKGTRKL